MFRDGVLSRTLHSAYHFEELEEVLLTVAAGRSRKRQGMRRYNHVPWAIA